MIKKTANLLLIIFVFLQGSYCQTGSYIQNPKILFSYIHFTSQGKYINGLKDGSWKDISDSGVIYVDGYYSHGKPVSEWKINYPTGVLRKAILYDSSGNVIKWTKYDLITKKLLEIIPDSIIPFYEMRKISNLEEIFFDAQATDDTPDYHSVTNKQALKMNGNFFYWKYQGPTNIVFIADSLQGSEFQGKCLVFDESGNVSKKYTFKKGSPVDIRQFNYKHGKLKIEEVYIDHKLKKTIQFDESGNVIKIKEK